MLCRKCGKENEEKAKYCSFCGVKLLKEESADVSQYQKKYDKRLKKKRTIHMGILIAVILTVAGAVCVAAIVQLRRPNSSESDKKVTEESSSKSAENAVTQEADAEAEKEDMKIQVCDSIKQTYGVASGEIFISSDMAELQGWPVSATGYINHITADISEDGEDELLIIYIEPDTHNLYLELYGFNGTEYVCLKQCKVGCLNAFSQFTLYMYKNESSGKYQIFYTDNSVGSYTGILAFNARLFTVDKSIEEVASWEWTDAVNTLEEANGIRVGMREWGIEYLEAGKLSFGQFDENKQIMLAKSNVNVYGEQPAMYTVEMQILNHNQLYQ